jgi:bifunctional DNA-binding transcriptional regulator/antitoxin component of YhaV-PrlF toxin-antitoxin module
MEIAMIFKVDIEFDDEGNAIIPIPQELLDQLKWKEGDILSFEPASFILKKVNADEK